MTSLQLFTWFIIGILADIIIAKISDANNIKAHIGQVRIHHSIYGVILIGAGFFIYGDVLTGFGLGLLFSHTVRLKKLLFFERMSVKKSRD